MPNPPTKTPSNGLLSSGRNKGRRRSKGKEKNFKEWGERKEKKA